MRGAVGRGDPGSQEPAPAVAGGRSAAANGRRRPVVRLAAVLGLALARWARGDCETPVPVRIELIRFGVAMCGTGC